MRYFIFFFLIKQLKGIIGFKKLPNKYGKKLDLKIRKITSKPQNSFSLQL